LRVGVTEREKKIVEKRERCKERVRGHRGERRRGTERTSEEGID